MKLKSSRMLMLIIVAFVASATASPQKQNWVLPVADGGPQPSPPSVHGYLVRVTKRTIIVRREVRDAKTRSAVTVQLKAKTNFFTAYGGPYTPDQLCSGQYVWVWY